MIDKYQDIINTLNAGEFDFDSMAIDIFEYQRKTNPSYQQFLSLVGGDHQPMAITDISFCPIAAFKHREVVSGNWLSGSQYFMSSGTGGHRSKHFVRNIDLYHKIAIQIFESHFGDLCQYQVLTLLPHYSDNPYSSLLSMVHSFERYSKYDGSSFLADFEGLSNHINDNKLKGIPTILFGVSFALLDYAEQFEHHLNDDFIIIETGGMKKFKREMTKEEIIQTLKSTFSGAQVCSEYGMTECLSQSYSQNSSWLNMNNYFRVVITDPMDPGEVLPHGRTGRINIMDLANVDTLSFIATDDMGRVSPDNPTQFEVLGRLSNTELRGCNYLI